MQSLLNILQETIVQGRVNETPEAVRQALDKGAPPADLIETMQTGMTVVGDQFSKGEYFIPDMLVGAEAMKAGMEILKPMLVNSGVRPKGTVVAFTVEGDIHDIGKDMVCMYYKGAGFEVVDLGVNVSPENAVQAIREHNADLCSISALLSTTRANIPGTIKAIRSAGLDVKIMIGGAPIDQDFADLTGADGYAPDAGAAARKAVELMGPPA